MCCTIPAFAKSSDFAIDKPAGKPCPNLTSDARCGIHAELRDRGFPGCVAYDCFGAGQLLTQVTYGGRLRNPVGRSAPELFAVFAVMCVVQQLRCYLHQAAGWPSSGPLQEGLGAAAARLEALTVEHRDALARLDVDQLRGEVNPLLLAASERARSAAPAFAVDHRGADLAGSSFRGADLRGAGFRGALLIGADLRGADLRRADLIGADLRGADLGGADLREALFLTQPQLDSARGDAATRIDPSLDRPSHWSRDDPGRR